MPQEERTLRKRFIPCVWTSEVLYDGRKAQVEYVAVSLRRLLSILGKAKCLYHSGLCDWKWLDIRPSANKALTS
jgi:hypothetical protein